MALDTQAKRDFKVVGTRVARPDGIDKVTGKATYGADISAPGMLYGRILRSPHAHAKILSIDVSAAEAAPGVKAVITTADFATPEDEYFADVRDNCLAREKVLYDGHSVAAVAATSKSAAKAAIRFTIGMGGLLTLGWVDYQIQMRGPQWANLFTTPMPGLNGC